MAAARDGMDERRVDADRLLAWAVAASLVAHALVLAVLQNAFEPTKRKANQPPSLTARLVQPQSLPEPIVEPKPAALPPREIHRKPVPFERPRPTLVAPAPPQPSPAQIAAPAVAEPPKTSEPPRPVAPASVQPPVARIESAPPPASVPAPSDAMDPATLGQYRIAIITAAKRYKRYPRLAIDNNWEGQAEIRMVIGADGDIASISIKSRSGFEVLDQQAIDMIRKAKPLTPIPPALRGRGFTVDVPVVFSLKEEAS